MKNSGNKKRSKKMSSRTANLIKALVAAVLIVSVVGYFVYITGILPKTLTGVTVTETAEDGTTSVLGKASVLETNFYYAEQYNTYYYYGMVTADTLDDVYDSETGETYREMLLGLAADEIMNNMLVGRAAEEAGFSELSRADAYAEYDLEQIESTAELYGYSTTDHYLSAAYGTGMNVRLYKQYVAKSILAQEYAEYVQQFDLMPTDEEVEAAYSGNSDEYMLVDFNYYYVPAETDDDGNATEEGLADAKAAAEEIAKATDSDSFDAAVAAYLEETGDTESAESYESGESTTYTEGFTSAYLAYLEDGFDEFLFDEANLGKTTVIESDAGVYVALLDKIYADETATVSYRTLTLTNDNTDGTDEEIAASAADLKAEAEALVSGGTMSSLDFYKLIKDNTDDMTEVVTGGYNSDVTIDNFVVEEEEAEETTEETETEAEEETEPEYTELGQWLFAGDRAEGDTYIETSDDNSTVTIYYFIDNVPGWKASVRSSLLSENYEAWQAGLEANSPEYVINVGWVKKFIY